METIYEAFTSGKEVRRRSGELIKAMVRIDWKDVAQPILAVDETGYHSSHYDDGVYDEGPCGHDLIIHQPDPRDEVIKAAEAWYDQIGVTYIQKHAAPIVLDLKAAIEKLRKNRDNGL